MWGTLRQAQGEALHSPGRRLPFDKLRTPRPLHSRRECLIPPLAVH
jgi:hypothetical protein